MDYFKEHKNKIFFLLFIALLIGGLCVFPHVTRAPHEFAAGEQRSDDPDVPISTELNVPPGAEDMIRFEDDFTGAASQTVSVGDYEAVITVDFQYASEGKGYSIQSLTGAHALSKKGWQFVQYDAAIDTEKVSFTADKTKASIPVTYYASIGVGTVAYDDILVIDLSNVENSSIFQDQIQQ